MPGEVTFAVGVNTGHVGIPWPLGRLDVSNERLRVRGWPVAWFKERSAPRTSVEGISAQISGWRPVLWIQDSGARFAKVEVEIPVGTDAIISELRRKGYPVVDRRPRSAIVMAGQGEMVRVGSSQGIILKNGN
jgi:hypothetical protein